MEFYVVRELNKLISALSKLKIDVTDYSSEKEINRLVMPKKRRDKIKKKKVPEKTPLFKVKFDSEKKDVYSLKTLLDFIMEVAKRGMTIQRYKGLGEMNPEQLWETTMDPERRTVQQVTVDDAVEADAMFTVLMGDQVEPRRKFIEKHAPEVKILDI